MWSKGGRGRCRGTVAGLEGDGQTQGEGAATLAPPVLCMYVGLLRGLLEADGSSRFRALGWIPMQPAECGGANVNVVEDMWGAKRH